MYQEGQDTNVNFYNIDPQKASLFPPRPKTLYHPNNYHDYPQLNTSPNLSSLPNEWYTKVPSQASAAAPPPVVSAPYPKNYSTEKSYPVIPAELRVPNMNVNKYPSPISPCYQPLAQTASVSGNEYLVGNIGESSSGLPSEVRSSVGNQDEVLDELPLLEELGIYPENIMKRMGSALLFFKIDQALLLDVDMCGPLFVAVCLAVCLLLAGKAHFGYIYGLSVTGCIGLHLLLNLMSQNYGVNVYKTVSILGYGLLPVVGLAAVSVVFSLRNVVGAILSSVTVVWCTATASRFFEIALEMKHQRFLVAYPIFLLYGSFVLITVF